VLLPDHYFITDNLEVTFRKEDPESSSGKFAVILSKKQSVLLPGTDIRVCYSSSGGSYKDLIKYFSDVPIPAHEFCMQWRDKEGKMNTWQGLATACRTGNSACEFDGFKYLRMNGNTFKGMCGATLVAKRKPIITSIHLGGKTGTPRGCSGFIQKRALRDAIDKLSEIEGVLITGTAERFEQQVLGVQVLTKEPLHPKSPLNYLPKNSQIEYYGSCPGRTTFKSDVKNTIISDIVAEVTGVKNTFVPPVEHPEWFGWQKCLENMAVPALPFEPDLLEIAIKDYKEALLPIFKNPIWNGAKPLTDHENLCGIPGKKFMDAIKLDTSIGFPLKGPKRKFVIELEPTPDKPNNRELDPVIMAEIKRCEDCYKRGERAYPIAKACKKDEVLTKPKCRIFYSNAIALTWLVRKYFLPILRVLQMNPLKSECAVGINSHGPEWEELERFIKKFGGRKIFGGDYAKYDQKLSSQILLAALRILCDLASVCNYSREDLLIMRAMAGDLVFAIIAFNGDLIGLKEGSHISGNSLTVIINSICGSLNLRCFFYNEYPCNSFETRMKFRDFVALATYGDDNGGGVHDDASRFTIKRASEFLAKYGQTYTMPDKDSELQDYLPPGAFEFLKRKSVYHPKLGVNVGALCEQSCFKMLHCYLRGKNSPLTEEHACGQNIDTAIREWFNHGEELYEKRRSEMKIVAEKAGITHLCTELEVDYDQRVAQWRAKYLDKHYEMFNSPDNFEC
jgi:hypothetical protein